MKSNCCDFGACKKKQAVRVDMKNVKTSEARSASVCRDHLRDVLAGCQSEGLLSQITVLQK
jgi:hypothetical protein